MRASCVQCYPVISAQIPTSAAADMRVTKVCVQRMGTESSEAICRYLATRAGWHGLCLIVSARCFEFFWEIAV